MATVRPLPSFPTAADDPDPEETQEWLESIDSVLRVHGADRAHYLLECMIDHARRSGA
jgi:pyruvate dehydrogenase E1 component